jgi:hypothetical protein
VLFQMCYGPEIAVILQVIHENPGIDVMQLQERLQYRTEGDVSSLIESAVHFLKELKFVEVSEGRHFSLRGLWRDSDFLLRLKEVPSETQEASFNVVFANLYNQCFVKRDELFVQNLHALVNSMYPDFAIGHEKINAWKRMMECFGIGRRVYSGFYALPRLSLIVELLERIGEWEGPLQRFAEEELGRFLPCMTHTGSIFLGLQQAIYFLHQQGHVQLRLKQDLPYKSYYTTDPKNWIIVRGGERNDSLHLA